MNRQDVGSEDEEIYNSYEVRKFSLVVPNHLKYHKDFSKTREYQSHQQIIPSEKEKCQKLTFDFSHFFLLYHRKRVAVFILPTYNEPSKQGGNG